MKINKRFIMTIVLTLFMGILTSTIEVEAKVKDIGYDKIFNAVYYADRYPDLKNAYGYNNKLLYEHFLNYGMYEGRDAHPEFCIGKYKESYDDLRTAFGNNNEKYYEHFITYGMKEGRYSGIETNYWSQYSTSSPDVDNANSINANDVTIIVMDDVNPSFADNTRYYLEMLPDNYLKSFIDNGWRIEIHSSLGSNEWGNIGGITYLGENLIKLRADSIKWAILHEFGHYIDFIKSTEGWWISDDSEFMGIYNNEVGNCGLSRYYTKDSLEYFAECFRHTYQNESRASKNFSNTYNFIKQLEN